MLKLIIIIMDLLFKHVIIVKVKKLVIMALLKQEVIIKFKLMNIKVMEYILIM